MSEYRLKKGVAVIEDGDSERFIIDETGRKKVVSALASELLGLIGHGPVDEDDLAAALEDRFSPEQVFYTLIQLEKQGVIARAEGEEASSADLFRAKANGREQVGYPPLRSTVMTVCVVSVGGDHSFADALAGSLSRSEVLRLERIPNWRSVELNTDALYAAVTPDYLEHELEEFGRFAFERGLRWLPVKLRGVIPSIGPLFVPEKPGCISCLLDRVKGRRSLDSLGLSVGETVHSFDVVAGLLAVELEKPATGGESDLLNNVLTLDFRTLDLVRHPFIKRPQCPVCGKLSAGNGRDSPVPEEPLILQTRPKADWRDGGERICSAVETLEQYGHLISPVTGVVGRLTGLKDIPPCFGHVVRSDWNVRDIGEKGPDGRNERFSAVGHSTGKGRSMPQARASALGEAVERYSSQYEGYESRIRAAFRDLGETAVHPYDLMGFSERQYRDREVWRRKGETSYVPDPYDEGRPIDWTPAWSLNGKRWRLIPAAFAYYSYPREGGGDICRGCSNGVAAGNCLEEAVMQGFYELVERDAAAVWWYHRLLKPAVDWTTFDSPFTAAVNAAMEEMGMRFAVLDLTHDLGIPVFAANLFSFEKEWYFKSIGLGCHRNPLIALERAVAELGQFWKTMDIDPACLQFQKSLHSREPFLRADPRQQPRMYSDFAFREQSDFLEDIEDMAQLLDERGMEMLVMDLTRPDVGFPVARVMVPGMVHFWPRFGCRRLFEVPKAAGWVDKDAGEDDLNPLPFFL